MLFLHQESISTYSVLMPEQPDLSALDDQLLDGLSFCSKGYDLFDQIMAQPDGVGLIRTRPTVVEKRLIEEILPIASYVQQKYSAGNRFKIQWSNGSQSYDALLFAPQLMVEKAKIPEQITVEATCAVHENDHWSRRIGHADGISWGPRNLQRDPKTGKVELKPQAIGWHEKVKELADFIIKRLLEKSQGHYPIETVLVVSCTSFGTMDEIEWNHTVDLVKQTELHKNFREVHLCELAKNNRATLWGGSANRRSQQPTA